MKLDVLLPTYNRATLLARAIKSLYDAEVPDGLEVRLTVVDNNSKDETRRVVEDFEERFDGRLTYLFEGTAGKSHALNAGIRATTGDLVGMIDDDEEVHEDWYKTVERAFRDESVNYIGGPYIPRWGAEQPQWLPMGYLGVIGWVDSGDQEADFSESFAGMLMGGNAVIRRETLDRVGPYTVTLGRTDKHLLSCEDEEMYKRLLAAKARGRYRPDLKIYHYVPPERLTKRYFRQWCYWRGVSLAQMDGRQPSAVPRLLGVPRWQVGRALRGALRISKSALSPNKDASARFADELAVWDFLGFFYGKHLYKSSDR